MLRPYLGLIGHLFVIIAFICSLFSIYFYYLYAKSKDRFWQKVARFSFCIHGLSIVAVVLSLFSILQNKYFEYHYAWDNTSLSLPFGYAISTFWQDQEGSFLLWLFWNVLLGGILLFQFSKNKTSFSIYESPSMLVFSMIQAFLTSMILGTVLFADFKLGSSPFLLLKETLPELPVWKSNPDFIPLDGNGLNPLLQNYWMVIHPPTLFLGFAATQIPFCLTIASLWLKDFKQWINFTLPWTLFSSAVLGIGIMMGAIWAYETLNFGGYWNWDPVENAVYVPWLILVAGIHTLFLAHKSNSALRFSYIFITAQFLLILYSTFLTRSGILGTSSVHSFTDLGLSGQLLLYLLFFLLLSLILIGIRWKELPVDSKETSIYSAEFWIIIGAIVLVLAAFQVILTTSIPVYNKIGELFGKKLNLAMPTEPLKHYTEFQMWFFILIILLTGIAQFFWWKNIKKENLNVFLSPLIVSLFLSAILIPLTGIRHWQYVLLLSAAMFALVSNISITLRVIKTTPAVVGSALSHTGIALMLLGIMYSSAYEEVVSLNMTSEKIFQNQKDNSENVLLYLNRSKALQGFEMTYGGEFIDIRKVPGYIEKRFVKPLAESNFKGILKADLIDGKKKYFNKGDTIEYEAENTYYQIKYQPKDKDSVNLYPRFQINEAMGNVASPDIKKYWNKDIYMHVNYVTTTEERKWSIPENYTVAIGDTFFLNDYIAILDRIEPLRDKVENIELGLQDIAAKAHLRILERDGERNMEPIFAIKNQDVWSLPAESLELGLRIFLRHIDPINGRFTFEVSRGQRDYVVIKAIEKPGINLLWIGTLLLFTGMLIAMVKRFKKIPT